MKRALFVLLVAVCLVGFSSTSFGGPGIGGPKARIEKSRGQLVYAPTAYLEFINGTGDDAVYQYAVSRIVIRNIDPNGPITVNSAKFHDQNGIERADLLEGPVTIGALESVTIGVNFSALLPHGVWPGETDGGRSFVLLDWDADKKVITPRFATVVGFLKFSGNPFGGEFVTWTFNSMISAPASVLNEK